MRAIEAFGLVAILAIVVVAAYFAFVVAKRPGN